MNAGIVLKMGSARMGSYTTLIYHDRADRELVGERSGTGVIAKLASDPLRSHASLFNAMLLQKD